MQDLQKTLLDLVRQNEQLKAQVGRLGRQQSALRVPSVGVADDPRCQVSAAEGRRMHLKQAPCLPTPLTPPQAAARQELLNREARLRSELQLLIAALWIRQGGGGGDRGGSARVAAAPVLNLGVCANDVIVALEAGAWRRQGVVGIGACGGPRAACQRACATVVKNLCAC